jgi:hypothetical protein
MSAAKNPSNKEPDAGIGKVVIDALPTNAFRVVGVGQDIVVESFYIYPDFSTLGQTEQGQDFNMDPDGHSEPNIRLVMNRDVAVRLTNAMLATLGVRIQPASDETSDAMEPATAGVS